MPSSPLEVLSILLVEDNQYVREMMESLLRQLGFNRISSVKNGEQAVEFLRGTGKASGWGGGGTPDLIISDLVMSPINGVLLLRWVRMDKDSPNRFLPFIMLSGAADREYVSAARDLGVNSFLAKPFSVQTVYTHLKVLIEYPRQFVRSQNYFGPDRRRRRDGPPTAGERRREGEAHCTMVYSPRDVTRPKEGTDVLLFRLPNALKSKMGGNATRPFELPAELLLSAEKQMEAKALDFGDWAVSYIRRLGELVESVAKKEAGRRREFDEVNMIAHELRGQGGTFGYPLITAFAKSLYEATMTGCREDENTVTLIRAHVDSMRAVIREKIAGDGGEVGRALTAGLHSALEKHARASKPKPADNPVLGPGATGS